MKGYWGTVCSHQRSDFFVGKARFGANNTEKQKTLNSLLEQVCEKLKAKEEVLFLAKGVLFGNAESMWRSRAMYSPSLENGPKVLNQPFANSHKTRVLQKALKIDHLL